MSPQRHVYVLRIWVGPDDLDPAGPEVVRGSLQPVDSGRTFYFDSLDQIVQILGEAIDRPDESLGGNPAGE